jgi:hypothetical protein
MTDQIAYDDNPDLKVLRAMTLGAYDLQKIRIQMGLRLCANFRSRLSVLAGEEPDEEGELSEEATKIIDQLKESYKRLTDGVAKNRTLPERRGFTGDELISTHAELTLIHQYVSLERQESQLFRLIQPVLEIFPIYNEYLAKQHGVGVQMAAIIMTYLDPHKARHPSSFWRYSGLDVGPDGAGRSRREAHLIDHSYKDKNGEMKIRRGLTYNPLLKTKLVGVLATSFMRSASPWRDSYNGYKHRLQTDPNRVKVTIEEWKRRNKAKEDVSRLWAPSRIHHASLRYMVKMFLLDLWREWRKMEGLPVERGSYEEEKHRRQHGRDDREAPRDAAE